MFVNISLHVLILFMILTIFFQLYISREETATFEQQIGPVIDDKLGQALASYDTTGQLKQQLKTLPYESLKQVYGRPDKATVIYNAWLFRMMFVIIGAIFITTAIVIIYSYLSCGQCVPIAQIVIENFVVFSFVGVVEFLFFTHIASKFVPVPPSFLSTRVITDLQNLGEPAATQ